MSAPRQTSNRKRYTAICSTKMTNHPSSKSWMDRLMIRQAVIWLVFTYSNVGVGIGMVIHQCLITRMGRLNRS